MPLLGTVPVATEAALKGGGGGGGGKLQLEATM